VKIGLGLAQLTDERLRYVKQLGCDGGFVHAQAVPGLNQTGAATAEELAGVRALVESYGLEVLLLRLDYHRHEGILWGLPHRDKEIADISATIRAAGKAGIHTVIVCLTPWRSLPLGWGQTPGRPGPKEGDLRNGSGPGRYTRPVGRGGAVLLTHDRARAAEDAAQAPAETNAPHGHVTAEEMWDRIRYFYERIIPVAEEAGVNIGAHPNDPPEKLYRGVEQVLHTADGLKKLVDLVPSSRNGLLLCLGTLHEMGTSAADTMAAIEYFVKRKKIFNAHFRNPKGTIPNGYYQEDFLDEGDMDMLAVMRLLHQNDYDGSLDPDHAVGIVGDQGGRIGFAWEIGYMKALRWAVERGA
jgi:mannonate dehydratase